MDNGVRGLSQADAREMTREIDRATDLVANGQAEAQGAEVNDSAQRGMDGRTERGANGSVEQGKNDLVVERGVTAGLGRQAIFSAPDEGQVAQSSKQLKLWAAARTEAAKTVVDELAAGASEGWQPGELSTETQQLEGEALEKKVLESNLGIKERVAIENGYKDNGIEVGASVIGGESALQIEGRKAEDYEDALVDAGERVDLRQKNDTLTKRAVSAIKQIIKEKARTPAALEKAWFEQTNEFLYENFQRKIGDRN